jgi:hypothetical protein
MVVGDFTLAIYSLLYLGILGSFTYIVMTSMARGIELKFGVQDLSLNFGLYFMLIGFHYLQLTYMADASVQGMLEILINVGVWTNCVLPALYFIMTLTIGSWMAKRVKGVDMA